MSWDHLFNLRKKRLKGHQGVLISNVNLEAQSSKAQIFLKKIIIKQKTMAQAAASSAHLKKGRTGTGFAWWVGWGMISWNKLTYWVITWRITPGRMPSATGAVWISTDLNVCKPFFSAKLLSSLLSWNQDFIENPNVKISTTTIKAITHGQNQFNLNFNLHVLPIKGLIQQIFRYSI